MAFAAGAISLYPGAAGPVSGWWLPMVTVSAVTPGVVAAVFPPLLLPVPQPLTARAIATPTTSGPVSAPRSRCRLLMMSSLLLHAGWARVRRTPGALGRPGQPGG